MKIALAVLATVVVAAAPASAAELLTNGSFESPSAYFTTCSGTQIPGWTVTTNNVDIASNAIYGAATYAYQGTQWLDLVGSGTTGAIAQTFATTAGASYTLSFAYANNPDFASSSASVAVTGLAGLLAVNVTHGGSTRTNNGAGWLVYTGSFVADSASTTLTFTDTSHNTNAGIYLDAVSVQNAVSGVPEPASWAMLTIGFGAVGATLRRRGRNRVAALA